ncbi:type VI secretion system baseplate subunit TssE [Azovibrio restrictus]|uniref:type VI secretion system baseplate subunit TssE n=1 Tax=Azovibrio restrictus TaxID=146938 RepID=UPI00041C0E1E|nr:type VI secretion system baseplate subunit TssE [Azovibrio restrictus]MCE1171606.1 type VI secretion system baseplate subunit TssE [Azovibrio sp.]
MRSEHQRLLVRPSVLDRLLDDQPRIPTDTTQQLAADLGRLKHAVARDLEALLNSRCVDVDELIDEYPEVLDSVLDFGITDLSSLSLLDPGDRDFLRDKIRIAIERHEPRLEGVKVSLEAPSGIERMLKFRVDAILRILPSRPPVSFNATLQPSSNSCQIRET